MGTFFLRQDAFDHEAPLPCPPSAGAALEFWGIVRDHNDGRSVRGLEYSVYPELAAKEGQRIVDEATVRFGLVQARAQHRYGALKIGDAALWVEVYAGHRGEAFEACRWIVDEIKKRVPIWKQELYVEGDRQWVMCHHETITPGN